MVKPELFQPEPVAIDGPNPRISGDVFNVLFPYTQIPWLPGIAGCDLFAERDANTVWVDPNLPKNWFELENFGFSPSQEWMDRLLDFTDYIVKNYSDRCVPSLDMIARGIADLALNLLGGDRYFFEFSDHPDALKRLLAPLCDLHINWAKRQMQRIPKFHGGYCNQYGLWSPGEVTRFQEDYVGCISEKTYKDFIMEYDLKVIENIEYAVLHTHSGIPQFAEWALEMEDLKVIEMYLDPETENLEERIDLWNKILDKKSLIIAGFVSNEELDLLLERLNPSGLLLDIAIKGEDNESIWKVRI